MFKNALNRFFSLKHLFIQSFLSGLFLISCPVSGISGDVEITASETGMQSSADFFSRLASDRFLKQIKPAWMHSMNYGFSFREQLKPEYYLESIIPVYQDDTRTDTLFIQARTAYSGTNRDVYNLGGVWRHYYPDLKALIGINMFGDFQRDPGFGRLGFGIDWQGLNYEARVNSYYRLGPKRRIQETSNTLIYEQVLDGYDAEIGLRLPYFRNIKIFAGGEIYDFKHGKNMYGWTGRLEYKPADNLVMNLYLKDNTYTDDPEWRFDIRYTVYEPDIRGGSADITEQEISGPAEDVRNRAYERVERENRILRERFGSGKNNGITFLIGRA